MYVVIDLPGITACDREAENCAGLAGGAQFPAVGGNGSCEPCKSQDEQVYAEYLEDNFSAAGSVEKDEMMKRAKDRWNRDRNGGCTLLECCDDADDCIGALCPETGGVFAHWANSVGQVLVKAARLVIGGSTIDTLYSEFLWMWEELTGFVKTLARNSRLRIRKGPSESRIDVMQWYLLVGSGLAGLCTSRA